MRVEKLQPLVFCFSDVTALCEAVTKIYAVYPKVESQLCVYKEKYFLAIYSPLSKRHRVYGLLIEYGEFLGPGSVKFAFFEEHGKAVSKNAVSQMGLAFEKKSGKMQKTFSNGG